MSTFFSTPHSFSKATQQFRFPPSNPQSQLLVPQSTPLNSTQDPAPVKHIRVRQSTNFASLKSSLSSIRFFQKRSNSISDGYTSSEGVIQEPQPTYYPSRPAVTRYPSQKRTSILWRNRLSRNLSANHVINISGDSDFSPGQSFSIGRTSLQTERQRPPPIPIPTSKSLVDVTTTFNNEIRRNSTCSESSGNWSESDAEKDIFLNPITSEIVGNATRVNVRRSAARLMSVDSLSQASSLNFPQSPRQLVHHSSGDLGSVHLCSPTYVPPLRSVDQVPPEQSPTLKCAFDLPDSPSYSVHSVVQEDGDRTLVDSDGCPESLLNEDTLSSFGNQPGTEMQSVLGQKSSIDQMARQWEEPTINLVFPSLSSNKKRRRDGELCKKAKRRGLIQPKQLQLAPIMCGAEEEDIIAEMGFNVQWGGTSQQGYLFVAENKKYKYCVYFSPANKPQRWNMVLYQAQPQSPAFGAVLADVLFDSFTGEEQFDLVCQTRKVVPNTWFLRQRRGVDSWKEMDVIGPMLEESNEISVVKFQWNFQGQRDHLKPGICLKPSGERAATWLPKAKMGKLIFYQTTLSEREILLLSCFRAEFSRA